MSRRKKVNDHKNLLTKPSGQLRIPVEYNIAHRLSTVVDAHEILVMEDGRIVERGTHAELLELDQKYEKMWNLQQSSE